MLDENLTSINPVSVISKCFSEVVKSGNKLVRLIRMFFEFISLHKNKTYEQRLKEFNLSNMCRNLLEAFNMFPDLDNANIKDCPLINRDNTTPDNGYKIRGRRFLLSCSRANFLIY